MKLASKGLSLVESIVGLALISLGTFTLIRLLNHNSEIQSEDIQKWRAELIAESVANAISTQNHVTLELMIGDGNSSKSGDSTTSSDLASAFVEAKLIKKISYTIKTTDNLSVAKPIKLSAPKSTLYDLQTTIKVTVEYYPEFVTTSSPTRQVEWTKTIPMLN